MGFREIGSRFGGIIVNNLNPLVIWVKWMAMEDDGIKRDRWRNDESVKSFGMVLFLYRSIISNIVAFWNGMVIRMESKRIEIENLNTELCYLMGVWYLLEITKLDYKVENNIVCVSCVKFVCHLEVKVMETSNRDHFGN